MTRRRAVALARSCVLGLLLVVAGCSSSDGADAAGTGSSSDGSDATSTAPTAADPADGCDGVRPVDATSEADGTTPAAEAAGTYAVGRESRTFVDTTRGTDADVDRGLAAAPTRTVPVSVLYPAAGAPAAPGGFVQDAPAADGVFPLVVYSHGVWSNGSERNDTLARWASAGYVVIAPTFPLSSGLGAKITDLVNQPGDVVFVKDAFTAAVGNDADELHGVVATECLALAGHSLGGATTLATAFDPCCGQLPVRAVVDISGVLLQVTPGATLSDSPPIPTMIVHGDQDPLVEYSQAQRAFAELTGPRWLVTLQGGDHNSMFVAPQSAVLDASAIALFDAELKGEGELLARLPENISASDVPATYAAQTP
jgi:predicted dienelactone hydrolase